jgi:phosphatidate cytidylyltransferase
MKDIARRTITAIVLGSLFWISFIYLPPFYFSLVLLFILFHIIVIEWRRLFPITDPAFWLIMPIYPIIPFSFLISLNHQPAYRDLLLLLFIIVSSYDTGSYLVGNIIGRHKIAPKVSPGKTWEGAIGGYLFACIGLTIVLHETHGNTYFPMIAFFTFIICFLSFLGDLFESWLKRRAHIKDTGAILPGHGGFLDRFDGILFAIIFFYVFKEALQCIFFYQC